MSHDFFQIRWTDFGREPRCPPDPAYPNGIDLDGAKALGGPVCKVDLPYPARRCGFYHVKCNICGCSAAITTAGRPDDPRSVLLPCKLEGGKQ